jgi:hypothetical protein
LRWVRRTFARISLLVAVHVKGRGVFDEFIQPFSSCVAVGLDVVQDEDGLHDRGRSAWATTQLGEDLPGLEGGDRAFTAGADLRVGAVHGLLPT